MPSATMPTTVARGMRRPRMQGTPPIWSARTVIRSNVIESRSPLRPVRVREVAETRRSSADVGPPGGEVDRIEVAAAVVGRATEVVVDGVDVAIVEAAGRGDRVADVVCH